MVARIAFLFHLLLGTIVLGLCPSPSSAQGPYEAEATYYLAETPNFNLYAWVSLSDPRYSEYHTGMTQYWTLVPYQAQHVGRAHADGETDKTWTFRVLGSIGDVDAGDPPQFNTIQTVNQDIVFSEGESGTKQTPVLINNAGNQTRSSGAARYNTGPMPPRQ